MLLMNKQDDSSIGRALSELSQNVKDYCCILGFVVLLFLECHVIVECAR